MLRKSRTTLGSRFSSALRFLGLFISPLKEKVDGGRERV